jgi:hypothetical protein
LFLVLRYVAYGESAFATLRLFDYMRRSARKPAHRLRGIHPRRNGKPAVSVLKLYEDTSFEMVEKISQDAFFKRSARFSLGDH